MPCQVMFYNWRHTFPLYEGYVRIIFKRIDALGPPPPDLNDRILVRAPNLANDVVPLCICRLR